MPTSPVNTYTYDRAQPAISSLPHPTEAFKLAPNLVLAKGTVLGQITASGLYKAYASANVDGSQKARVILQYACTTDASGNVTDDIGGVSPTASAYIAGAFNISDLTGFDAQAATDLGARFINGAVGTANSILVF